MLLTFFLMTALLVYVWSTTQRRIAHFPFGTRFSLEQRAKSKFKHYMLWVLLCAFAALIVGLLLTYFVTNILVQMQMVREWSLSNIPRDSIHEKVFMNIVSQEGSARDLIENLQKYPLLGQNLSLFLPMAEHIKSLIRVSNILGLCFSISLAVLAAHVSLSFLSPKFNARSKLENLFMVFMKVCATFAVFISALLIISLAEKTFAFFQVVSLKEFFLGLSWRPVNDVSLIGSNIYFGVLPLLYGTFFISFIAILVAGPIAFFSAIYLAEYATPRTRTILKPALEVLAGIPSIVYGVLAALLLGPALLKLGNYLNIPTSLESALAAGLMMGIMIIPFITSLADDALTSVPTSIRDGSLALGSTQGEAIRRAIVPGALHGIYGGFLLAISRAIGETMIVVLAAGLTARFTLNPFESVTTVTVQIVQNLTGDQSFESPKTLALFTLGTTLFLLTFFLNYLSFKIIHKFKEQYD